MVCVSIGVTRTTGATRESPAGGFAAEKQQGGGPGLSKRD